MATPATAFDPDAYLGTSETDTAAPFDPDAYLAQEGTSAKPAAAKAAAPKKKPGFSDIWRQELQVAQQMFPIATPAAENIAQLATSAVSTPIAGVAGLGAGATHAAGLTETPAADVVGNVQDWTTYSPQTEMGQFVSGIVNAPQAALSHVADVAGENVAVPQNMNAPALMRIPGRGPLTRAQAASELGIDPNAPGLGAALNTAIQMAPALLLKGRGRAPSPMESPAARISEPTIAPAVANEAEALQTRPPRTAETLEMPAAGRTAEAPLKAEATGERQVAYEVPGKLEFPEEASPLPEGMPELPRAEQARRVETLRKIGLSEWRMSAETGDAKAAATEYQTSKLDNPSGNRMRHVIDSERNALQSYSEKLVRDTGGSPGTDQSAVHARGSTILEPLDALKDHFDNETRALYKAADERAGETPIQTPQTHSLLANEGAEFLGTVEGEALLRGVNARMKALGMVDKEGAPQAVTVKQAERFKQYLSQNWTPRTSRLIRQLKDAVDDDVMQAAGVDLYQKARASRALRARTLDDPNGIARIMDSEGPDGINRAVPVEKIPDAVANMPVAQLKHIIGTLRNVPEELQPRAQAAINEIRAHYANKIADAGQKTPGAWNNKAVTQYLNANAARMRLIFTPDEMANFRTLNDAGNILRKDTSYPGAAVQEHNLVRSGVMGGLRYGATSIGGSIGGPLGAAVGGVVGEKMAGKYGERAGLKQTEGRIRKLSDLLKEQPEQREPPK